MVVCREVPSRNINMEEFWESFDVVAEEAAGDYTATVELPANIIIRNVLAYVLNRPFGSATFVCGDSEDDDGYLLEQDISSSEAPGNLVHTLFGNDIDELGDLLVTHHTPQDPDYSDRQPLLSTDEALLGHFKSTASSLTGKITVGAVKGRARVRVWVKALRLITKED